MAVILALPGHHNAGRLPVPSYRGPITLKEEGRWQKRAGSSTLISWRARSGVPVRPILQSARSAARPLVALGTWRNPLGQRGLVLRCHAGVDHVPMMVTALPVETEVP